MSEIFLKMLIRIMQSKGTLQKHKNERQSEFPIERGNSLTLQNTRWVLLSAVAVLLKAVYSPGRLFICCVCRMETDPSPPSNFITNSAKHGRF